MQETHWKDRDGGINKMTEIFNVPADDNGSVMRRRYDEALKRVFGEGGELIRIEQRKIGRNDPCPCGSNRKFKRCCESKMNVEMATGGH